MMPWLPPVGELGTECLELTVQLAATGSGMAQTALGQGPLWPVAQCVRLGSAPIAWDWLGTVT